MIVNSFLNIFHFQEVMICYVIKPPGNDFFISYCVVQENIHPPPPLPVKLGSHASHSSLDSSLALFFPSDTDCGNLPRTGQG